MGKYRKYFFSVLIAANAQAPVNEEKGKRDITQDYKPEYRELIRDDMAAKRAEKIYRIKEHERFLQRREKR
jgi:hypothetical protein